MIEDKELRDLFRVECEEHLQCLDDGLLSLEQHSNDPTLLENIFRAAHSVKGAARMIGLNEIQSLAHILEDALGTLKKSGSSLDKNLAADLTQKLRRMRQLVAEAVGESIPEPVLPSPAVEHVAVPAPPAVETQIVTETASITSETATSQAKPSPPLSAEPLNPPQTKEAEFKTSAFRIGTLRVDPQRLDVLLTHAGELAVTNAHLVRRLSELDTLLDTCESWMRNLKAMGLSEQDESFALHGSSKIQTLVAQLRVGLSEDSRRLNFVSEQLNNGIRTIRLLPFSNLFNQFPRLVHELAQTLNKEVELVLEGAEVVADKRILEELKDPLMHLLRNALCHGLEDEPQRLQHGKPSRGKIVLRASQNADHIRLDVEDDGRGLDIAEIKHTALRLALYTEEQLALMNDNQLQALILLPGFTTSQVINEISGRGVGLDVVRTNVEKLKGNIQIHSTAGAGLTFRLQLPLTLATMRVQIISVQSRSYALPLDTIQFSRRIKTADLFTLESRQTLSLDGQPVAVAYLRDLLELPKLAETTTEILYVTFLKIEQELFGLIVDDLLDETEVMFKSQSKLLKRVRNVSATTILVSGEICPVLNPADLLKSMRKQYLQVSSSRVAAEVIVDTDSARKKVLLLVEDSITTRTQEKRILEGAGYEVVTAVDGLDGYNKFQRGEFDGVVSDVDMPNMNGLALATAIRKDKKHADIPIILVTSLSSVEDQRLGLEAGANAYLVKSAFDQKVLLDCLARLI